MYESIPDELKAVPQWVCWKSVPDESRPGKIKKIPINARTGGQAQSNNPDTWCGYETAVAASAGFSGIGFMFANGYFGVDIDGCEDAIAEYKSGEPDNIVSEFIHTLQSYAEYSVSGAGLHVICKGVLPSNGRRRKNVEMYENGRYFIMTGNSASEYEAITECTESIKVLHEKYIGGGMEPTTGFTPPAELQITDREILDLAMKSKQGSFFSDLYHGNWKAYYGSQSEADIAFCNMLAFWCAKDKAMMKQIFSTSGLMREKWNRKQSGSTYGDITLEKAIRGCSRVYEPVPEYSINIGATTAGKVKLYSFDDTGNAERFTDAFGESARYGYINKSWFYYDNRRWQQDIVGATKRMVDEIVEAMRYEMPKYIENAPDNIDPEEYEKQFMKHVKQSRSSKSKTAMLKEAEHCNPVTPDMFDRNKDMLNTPNGTINLRTGELLLHDKKRLITKITNVEYTDKIDAPLWTRFINEIFDGDAELIKFVQKAVGYSLTGSTKEDCVFFCYGTGRNGKSTFIDVITSILGDYSANIQPETIMVKNGGGSTSDIARLKGARFVTSAEPNEGVKLNEGLIKQLTGGDLVTASRKYENEFEFYPEFKLWMSTNHKPVIRGTDIGIWSRIRLIPFIVRIPDNIIDRNLKHKLKKEMSGILKWVVDGCLLWQSEGLKPPKAVLHAVEEYKNEMDVLSTFIDECCVVEPNTRTETKAMFRAYLEWAHDNNEFEMKGRKFAAEFLKRFVRIHSNSLYYYQGVRLSSDEYGYGINICS